MSVANILDDGVVITPQWLFRMSTLQRLGDVTRLTMDIDGIASASGSATAALGVLVDDSVGATLRDRRGTHAGLVTADLSVDFVTPTGWTGPELCAEGRVVAITGDGGVAVTEIRDADGVLVATATAWGNFVDGGVDRSGTVVRPVAAASGIPPAPLSPLERIGGRLVGTDRLVVPSNPALANKLGVMHGGVQACAMDLVGNAAVSTPNAPMHTASLRINYFRPAPVDTDVVFTTEVVRAGRSIAVVRVTSTDGEGRVCAVGTVTCRRPSAPTTPAR
ncbi:PaaI family thioesterase [Prescottella sp. R16]|uniref:PaaI family thioesterase n=1 Tax=Prescottella sp. R16 TaxID=3064529 RepID=UPI00272E29BF|nr:hotdog domain-containing protein [Prescottella sp. R16]